MSLADNLQSIWERTTLMQRALLVAVVLACALSTAVLTKWANQPNMRVLYQQLPAEEAAKITDKLSEKAIKYELRNGGTSIYVPEESVYQARLDLAKDGLPAGDQGGYKLFDNEKIGISPFVQSVNLNRALQDELARTIRMIDGVDFARVHLVRPEQTLFGPSMDKTTASVVLKLKPGFSLSQTNIAAISHLVAGSVEGLRSENVTVVDSTGKLLNNNSDDTVANGANTVLDYRQRVEQALAKKAQDMLDNVLGPGRATVSVAAVLNMNSVNHTKETYDPSSKIATKEEIKNKSEIGAGAVSADASKPAATGSTSKDETISTEYVVGKVTEQKIEMPGEIVSLSVSAIVDLSAPDGADANKPQSPALAVADVEEIIKNAIGLKSTDALKVVIAKFNRPQIANTIDADYQENLKWTRIIEIARQSSLGILAICALLILKIFSGSRKKGSPELAAQALSGMPQSAGMLTAGGPVSTDPLMLRNQISNALKSNPDEVRRIFANWAQEKGN